MSQSVQNWTRSLTSSFSSGSRAAVRDRLTYWPTRFNPWPLLLSPSRWTFSLSRDSRLS